MANDSCSWYLPKINGGGGASVLSGESGSICISRDSSLQDTAGPVRSSAGDDTRSRPFSSFRSSGFAMLFLTPASLLHWLRLSESYTLLRDCAPVAEEVPLASSLLGRFDSSAAPCRDGATSIGLAFWPVLSFLPRADRRCHIYIYPISKRGLTCKYPEGTSVAYHQPIFLMRTLQNHAHLGANRGDPQVPLGL